MPLDLTALNQAIQNITNDVSNAETIDDGAAKLISGQAEATRQAVAQALSGSDALNQQQLESVTTAINTVEQRFLAANTKLSDALTANTSASTSPESPSPSPTSQG